MDWAPRNINHRRALGVLIILCLGIETVVAHGTERGLVMLLPTGYFILGGALAVAASFVVLALAPSVWLRSFRNASIRVCTLPDISPFWPSNLAFALLCLLLYAGWTGSTDPLANPLPVFIWTVWWVGLTLTQCLVGNLWTHINPWSGPVRLTRSILGLGPAPFRLSEKLGYAPAGVVFFAFAWLELVYPAPDDPTRLAGFVLFYWCLVFVCILLFGERVWFARGEPFAIFFRLIGLCSPLIREHGGGSRVAIRLGWPGAGLLNAPGLSISGVLFVLLTLSTVSFDGLAKTFVWFAWTDVNPLEYPGRSALVIQNSWGLVLAFGLLAGCFMSCVWLGCVLAGRVDEFVHVCGRLVYSIMPISLVFHIAHYLTLLLVNGQYAVLSLNDPLGRGWDVLGLRGAHVTTSFLTNLHSVSVIWIAQTVIVVTGHVIGIVIAHGVAMQSFGARGTRSQIPLAVLMVAYTVFGLWLLSTASIG